MGKFNQYGLRSEEGSVVLATAVFRESLTIEKNEHRKKNELMLMVSVHPLEEVSILEEKTLCKCAPPLAQTSCTVLEKHCLSG